MPNLRVAVLVSVVGFAAIAQGAPRLLFSASESNDLLQVAKATFGPQVVRFDSPQQAIEAATAGDALVIVADGYPETPSAVSKTDLQAIRDKNLRCYVEYPDFLRGSQNFSATESHVERVVAVDNFFAPAIPRLSVLQANGLHYVPIDPSLREEFGKPILVAARVAGFDSAIFGLPEKTAPLLLVNDEQTLYLGATGLSHFRQGRYSPYSSWQAVWNTLLGHLMDSATPVAVAYPPAIVSATYGPSEPLPPAAQRKAIERGVAWFAKANMIVHPDWQVRVASPQVRVPPLEAGLPVGDGSLGSMEAILSIIKSDGHQVVSSVQRGDCIAETAMAHALYSRLSNDGAHQQTARNLLDYYLLDSEACKNERGDPSHGAYGLISWGITNPAWCVANYGDDNARIMLATMATAGVLGEDRWNKTIARCMIGNLRTTGQLGFRGDRIDIGPLGQNGWKHYFAQSPVSYAPHFECYLWACYLWAYSQTHDPLLLDRASTALEMTMQQYPDGLRWTNGLAQERARIVLPLAWLVRIDDSPKHRAMLTKAVDGLLSIQDECGAIREEIGPPGRGMFPPPGSNEAYGVSEASLIARNGDPVADMLYTNNFALLALHEAAAVMDDERVRHAEDRLADFLIRIQARSDEVQEVDGGWMRAFDFERWEHWGSNADHGWGAWSIESGWTQAWITSVLLMREKDTTLWELMSKADLSDDYPTIRDQMLPQEYVDEVESDDNEH